MKTSLFAMLLLTAIAIAGCKASAPGTMESTVAKEIKQKMTIGGKDVKNPTADTAEMAREGQEHFMHHCQICHGYDGQNTGVPFAEKMSPPVADLKSKDVQDYTDGQLKWIIENGIEPSGMPSWKGIVEEDEMWKMVRYIRHLPPKGSLGAPEIFKEEAEEHEHMKEGEKPAGKTDESKPHTHTHKH